MSKPLQLIGLLALLGCAVANAQDQGTMPSAEDRERLRETQERFQKMTCQTSSPLWCAVQAETTKLWEQGATEPELEELAAGSDPYMAGVAELMLGSRTFYGPKPVYYTHMARAAILLRTDEPIHTGEFYAATERLATLPYFVLAAELGGTWAQRTLSDVCEHPTFDHPCFTVDEIRIATETLAAMKQGELKVAQ